MVRKIVVTIIEKSMILAGTYREEGENELLKICLVPRSPSHVYRSRMYVLRWITAFRCFDIPDPPEVWTCKRTLKGTGRVSLLVWVIS